MPDDPVLSQENSPGDPPAGEAPSPTPAPEPEPQPHPLEPGGARFSEVYRDMQEARRENARLQVELDRYRTQAPPQPTPPKQFYSADQLQGLVDNGQITPAVMAAQIAWQERQIAKQEMRDEFSAAQRAQVAGAEVDRYMAEIPQLNDRASEEFRRVHGVVRELAAELGLSTDDARVQRRALQLTFGPVEKLQRSKHAAETTRVKSDTYVETGAGPVPGKASAGDLLKHVPQAYKDHWKTLGYTEAEMLAEAKYIRPTPRQRAGLWKP